MVTVIHGFELVEEREIAEINSVGRLYRHKKTGAELLSVMTDDDNKCFGITFRTPPTASDGIAHILEHSVLCGSRKYPIKDPFVELIKGSLNTFLNALTFPDKTMYPVASQNLADFYNLVDVYLDAVFYPRISPEVLMQEGWHYELADLEAPLTYKGVVYNEMKGAYSSPESVLGRYAQQALYPDTTYGVDSGGDPREIPNLDYETFRTFHEKYYHPSNARIYFYGDDDPEERLRLLDAYLGDFEAIPVESQIGLQEPFTEPHYTTHQYDPGEDAAKEMVTVGWMLPESEDSELLMAFDILEHVLYGSPAAPLRKALLESGLGENLTGSGFRSGLRQMSFSAGLKGVKVGDSPQVEKLILDTLADLVENGIDPDTVAASLNTTEFQLREFNTGRFPRGLAMMMMTFNTWLYDGNPLDPLAFEAPLQAIKAKVANGERLFEGLIQKYLLENTHRSTVVLAPKLGLNQELEAEEKARLQIVRDQLSPEAMQQIIDDAARLKAIQEAPEKPEDLATIPTLKLDDLDKTISTVPLEETTTGEIKTLYHDLFTNGLVYLDMAFNLGGLDAKYLPYMGLFGRALREMGTQKEDFVRISQRIGQKTGGIHTGSLMSQKVQYTESTAWMTLRAKATVAQVPDLLDIIQDILLIPSFADQSRFRQIVLESRAGLESHLVPSGHTVANGRLKAQFNLSSWAGEQMGGVSYLFFLRQLAERIESDWAGVQADLEAIRAHLVKRGNMLFNVTADQEGWSSTQSALAAFQDALPQGENTAVVWPGPAASVAEGLIIPAQVNYVAKGASLYDLGYAFHGSSLVAAKYLRTSWLWDRIRVHGGAYGAMAHYDTLGGVFNYLSYRDPNLVGTLENYDGSPAFLRGLEISQDELTKAIVGTIGDLDSYQLPDAKGYSSMVRYLVGTDDARRQRIRDEVLGTTLKDFHAFAEVLEQIITAGQVVVVGSEQAINEANAQLAQPLQVTRLL